MCSDINDWQPHKYWLTTHPEITSKKDKIKLPFDERKLTFNSTWIKGKGELSFILNVPSSMKAFNEKATRNKS